MNGGLIQTGLSRTPALGGIMQFELVAMAAVVFPCFLSKKVGSNKERISGVIKETSRRVNITLTMIRENHRTQRHAGYVVGAFVPFPRSTWIHPHAPHDDFDRVCKVIWARAKKCEERFGRGHGAADNKRRHRADEQQRNTNDSSENTQCEEERQQLYRTEFTLPCPYLSGRRRPCVAKSARAPSPVMEEKMKLSKEETERKGDLDKGEQQHKKILVPECRSQLINHYDPSSETSQTVDEQNKNNSSDGCSSGGDSDDGGVIVPGVRSRATDSSDASSASGTSDSEETQRSHTLFAKKDFPPLSTARHGLLPYPTGPPASGKLHGQWEIPLSFHPHNIPTDTLAPVQALVQGRAEAPRAASKTIAPLAAQTQRGPYDLLADFPALQPPTKPSALGELHGRNPKSRDAMGKREIIQQPNDHQETEASYESRVRNGPHEVSSICGRDQTSELSPQTFGSQSISKVAGTDGAGVNARSWAGVAKASMKQAAAPQERARPCSFQQIVTINRAKAVNHNTTNKATQSFIARQPQARGVGPLEAGSYRGLNRFVTPAYRPSQQRFGARAPRRAHRPLTSRLPLQQDQRQLFRAPTRVTPATTGSTGSTGNRITSA